jgi:hypothetical protein
MDKFIIEIKTKIKLLSWSNEKQKLVVIEDSVVKEFLSTKDYKEFCMKYESLSDDFLQHTREKVTSSKSLRKFKKKILPTYKFHPNLLKGFTEKELKEIMDTHFELYPILNVENFDSSLPNKIDGWFINDVMELGVTNDGIYIYDMSNLDDKPKTISCSDARRILGINNKN